MLKPGVLILALAVSLGAQAPSAKKPYTVPKTPWGDPDLQGVWPGTAMVGVPMERAKEFGTRNTLTDEEFARKVTHAQEQESIDTAEFVSRDPKISRGDGFVTCEQDPERFCAAVLDFLQLLPTRVDVLKIVEELFQQARAVTQIAGHLGKHRKKLYVSGDQTHHSFQLLCNRTI